MNKEFLENLLSNLLKRGENETIEFKEAKNDYSTDDIGKYFSALANEANLYRSDHAWLIFGISDSRKIVGTAYRKNSDSLQKLKQEITTHLQPRMSFREIFEIFTPQGRVILFKIPAAPHNIPVSWKNIEWGRNGSSLANLSWEEIDRIRNQEVKKDWSAELVPAATLDSLDPVALTRAREIFVEKDPELTENIRKSSDESFLQRLELIQNGSLTRAALLLLGKKESSHLLSPYEAIITIIHRA